MKITIVCDVLGKENNGTTTAALNLINYLIDKGYDVKVICPDQNRKDDKNFVVVPKVNFGIFNNYVEKNGVVLAKVDSAFLETEIKDSNIIHLLLPFGLSKKALKIAKKYDIPTTASFHAQAENLTSHVFLMNSKLVNHSIYKVFYHDVYRFVDAIHYPTQFIRDVFESNIHQKTNGYVISNGVKDMYKKIDVQRPSEYDGKYLILFTGRYSKEKSHKVIIDAINYSKYKDKIQLIFAGNGPLEEKIRKYSQKLTLNPIMKYFTREELVQVENYADLYVHPAEIEIEAIACVEAISCGLVPIISNSARCATKYFALTDKNLFECNNSIDLANKIDYWLEHPIEKKKLSEKYIDYAKDFNFNYCMSQMEKMILETYENHKHKK